MTGAITEAAPGGGSTRNVWASRVIGSILAVDVAFLADAAAIVTGRIVDLPTGFALMVDRLQLLEPPLAPADLRDAVRASYDGMNDPTVLLDVTNNLSVGSDLLSFVPPRRLLGLRFTGGGSHGLRPEPLLLGYDGQRRPVYVVSWTVGRLALLNELDRALAAELVMLPDGPEHNDALHELRRQAAAMQLQMTASGRERAASPVRDDLLIGLGMLWYGTALAARARPRVRREPARAPGASAWT